MTAADFKFLISPEKYLEKNHILVYIEDAICQLLDHKESNSKVNVTKFFSDYFNSVREGSHVLFREYNFVRATTHNRVCFVQTFWKCFRNIGKKGDLLSVVEYHSLLSLLCADFPFAPVQKTARIILMEDAMDCLISFPDFLYAFQVQFCYDEFLSKCAELYKDLQNNPQVSLDTVVVPTSEENAPPVHTACADLHSGPEGVDAGLFYRLLIPICEKLDKYAPSLVILKELLSVANRVTFYGFLMAMAKSEALNNSIGKLPNKGELLDIPETELSSHVGRPASATRDTVAGSLPGAHSSGEIRPSDNIVSTPSKTSSTASRRRHHISVQSDDDMDDDDNDDSSTN